MLTFTITLSAIMAVALTAQQLRIDFYKQKSIRYKKRINTLKHSVEYQADQIKRLDHLLTDAYAESKEKGHVINYLDHFMRNEPKYIEVVAKLEGGDE